MVVQCWVILMTVIDEWGLNNQRVRVNFEKN